MQEHCTCDILKEAQGKGKLKIWHGQGNDKYYAALYGENCPQEEDILSDLKFDKQYSIYYNVGITQSINDEIADAGV